MKNYTCSELIDEVKMQISNAEYSDSEILNYLNDAEFEILGEDKYPFLEKISSSDKLMDGKLDLPLDYQATIQILVNGEPLEYIPYSKYFSMKRTGVYTIFSDRVYFKMSEGCNHIDHLYLAKPAKLDMNDEPYIPYEFKEILVLGAMVRVERADGNYDYAETLRRHQDELIINMKRRYTHGGQTGQVRAKLNLGKMGRI